VGFVVARGAYLGRVLRDKPIARREGLRRVALAL
jgi:hypothetical protein